MEIVFKGRKREYQLASNEKSYALSEKVKVQTGKNKGQFTFSPIGYYSSIEHAINRAFHLEIHDSDADNFNALLKAIKDTKDWIGMLVSENFKLADLGYKN